MIVICAFVVLACIGLFVRSPRLFTIPLGFLVLSLLMLLCLQAEYASFPNRYEGVKVSIEGVRKDGMDSIVERKGTLPIIIEVNKEISIHKTWHRDIFIGAFFSDKIAKLEYLK